MTTLLRNRKFVDLSGRIFGEWLVLEPTDVFKGNVKKQRYYLCRCSCGTEKLVVGNNLRGGNTTSCGCKTQEITSLANSTHGMSRLREYKSWGHMIDRCTDPENEKYKDYGARGIVVCERWLTSPRNFLDDLGKCPPGKTLERKDVNGNYEPANCKWATPKEQANNKRNNVMLTWDGMTMNATQWGEYLGINHDTILGRVTRGYSIDKVLYVGRLRRRDAGIPKGVTA